MRESAGATPADSSFYQVKGMYGVILNLVSMGSIT